MWKMLLYETHLLDYFLTEVEYIYNKMNHLLIVPQKNRINF